MNVFATELRLLNYFAPSIYTAVHSAAPLLDASQAKVVFSSLTEGNRNLQRGRRDLRANLQLESDSRYLINVTSCDG
jgi:hypothetical protein